MCVFRGEGGEPERRPGKTCEVWSVHNGKISEERWPAILEDPRQALDEKMDIKDLAAVWHGQLQNDYAEAAVCGSLAIALRTMQLADSIEHAENMAREMWDTRDKTMVPGTV